MTDNQFDVIIIIESEREVSKNMEFEFKNSIYVTDGELKEMVTKVKSGQDFSKVFKDIIADWSDADYYQAHLIKDAVEKEVMKRI